jgi:hypothetical protein
MRIAILVLVLGAATLPAAAQAPAILGTWKLNVAASRLPGPPPQTHVRRYYLAPDGTLVGLAVVVDASGKPDFLQFAAKDDGKDYPELDSRFLAALQIDGSQTPRTYSETPLDERTVAWTDKYEGRVIASGKKWVSEDGQTLSFTARATNPRGEEVELLFVFDRQ